MSTWFGSEELKAKTVAGMKQSREQDQLIRGSFFEVSEFDESEFRGCAIGCLVVAHFPSAVTELSDDLKNMGGPDWHRITQDLYGIPLKIARYIDVLFEALPAEDCEAFAVEVIEAIPVGVEIPDFHPPVIFRDSFEAIRTEAADFIKFLKSFG